MTDDCGMLIKLIADRIDSRFEEELSSCGMSYTDLRFMRFVIVMDRPVRMRELEEYYGYAFPTVAGAVKSLERRGLVEQLPDESDRRVRLVSLTESGREAVQRMEALRRRMEDELTAGLDRSERETLVSLLERVREGFCGDDRGRIPPRDGKDVFGTLGSRYDPLDGDGIRNG